MIRFTRTAIVIALAASALAAQAFAQPRGPRSRTSTSQGRMAEAHFEIDEETGSLIIVTDSETNQYIGEVIRSLDRPVPQALIKVLFLEVTHSRGLDLGTEITYERTETDGRDLMTTLFGAPEGARGAAVAILENDLEVTLRALGEVGELEVLSRPSIMARNNEEAVITVGQEVPFIRNSRITQDGQTINTVEYEDIGIILTVTPRIMSDGMVELDVAPEISTLTGETVQISETVNAPVFAKRSAQTRVIVPSGKTIVIGGLMQDQETRTVQKVPILGDIWGLGMLFRREITSKSKTELLIFLTPYVIDSPAEGSRVTAAERNGAELIPQVFDEDELARYLDGAW